MIVRVELFISQRVAYLRHLGPYGLENIQIMKALKAWAKEKNLLNDNAIIFGIPLDNPSLVSQNHCRYDAAIIVDEKIDFNDINYRTLSEGYYAIINIPHTSQAVSKVYSDIPSIIRANQLIYDQSRPIMERYQMFLLKKHMCEICIPIKKSL